MEDVDQIDLCEHVPPITWRAFGSWDTGGANSCATAGTLEKLRLHPHNLEPKKECGPLFHHSLPITNLKLLEGVVLLASEGPSLLLKMAHVHSDPFQRYQLFPSQCVISGMEFVNCPSIECGPTPAVWHRRTEKPYDYLHVGFLWAGSLATLVRLTRSRGGALKLMEEEGKSGNEMVALEFIPVAAKWLEGGNLLALLSVLNYVVLYERVATVGSPQTFTALKELVRIKCDKSETLFSGTVSGTSRHDIRIFAGTVFNGILVWDVDRQDGVGVIRHQLKCHHGIVFSLEYYSCAKTLLSTSDDRTVAVWQFSGAKGQEEQVTLLQRYYGHDARVWKALLVRDYVISVGESSEVRVNSVKNGGEHKSWRAHDGGPIFTCAYDEDLNILYTGGGEGSIRKWPKWWYSLRPRALPFDPAAEDNCRIRIQLQGSGRWSMNKDFPKQVVLLDINHAVASMESGRIIGMTWEGKQFDLLHDDRCEGYQIIKICPDQRVIAVAGKDGHFYTAEIKFSENVSTKTTVMYARKLFMTKISWNILSMIWLHPSRLLIICCNRAIAIFFQSDNEGAATEGKLIQTFNLNFQRPGVPAAVEVNGTHIVLGDELGTFHLFRYHKRNEAIHKLENAHNDAVTHLLFHDSRLYSTARDGTLKSFSLNISVTNDLEADITPLASFPMPFEWVAGIHINMGQILVCGFQKEDFVIHSFNEKRTVAKIPCGGGGNRKWDFKYGHGLQGSINASFAFLKDKEIFYTFLPMAGCLNVIIKEGLHSRTINCALKLTSGRSSDGKHCYITGSEDGSLRWFEWERRERKISSVQDMENHVSSVRCARKITTRSNQTFLFTAGGRSQLCIYVIDLENRRMELLKEIILVKTSCKQTEGDVRIMDIAVVEMSEGDSDELLCLGACSDGFVRVVCFNAETVKFRIAAALRGNSHAVMKLQVLKTDILPRNALLVAGVTSNGYFILWSWSASSETCLTSSVGSLKSSQSSLPEKDAEFVQLLRRTSFLAMQVRSSEMNSCSIVCGGDDCSVSLWTLVMSRDTVGTSINYSLEQNWTRDECQRGAVVGVFLDSERIYSISNDQIVGYWNLDGDLERTTYAGVTDCQGFLIDKESECILCFGKGVAWVPIPN